MAIKNIKIRNKYLPYNDLELNFFYKNNKLSRELLIFGRNGTGKSTIANTIDRFKDCFEMSPELNIEYLDNTNKQSKFLIFNDYFIEKNIKFSESDNLKAIVMFDEQGDIERNIEILENRLENIENSKNFYNKKLECYNKQKELDGVLKLLRGDNNWAGRARLLDKNSKNNKRVDTSVLNKVLDYKNEEDLRVLFKKLDSQIEIINRYSNEDKIEEIEKYKGLEKNTQERIEKTLKDTINLRFSSNIDSKIEKIFDEFGNNHLQNLDEYLKANPEICKTYLRPLDKDYIQELREKLKFAFQNDLIEEKKEEINDLINTIKVENSLEFEKINTDDINLEIENLNKINRQIKEKLLHKSLNINSKINIDFKEYIEILNNLNYKVQNLNNDIREYNREIERLNDHKNTYEQINFKIAYKEIENEYFNYKTNIERHETYELKFNKCNKLINKLDLRIDKLKIKQAQTSIALEIMNRELALIFFDKNRLALVGKDGHYEILVRGQNIPMSKLSTGEKNVLSLVYFFSLLNTEKKILEMYKDTYFLVLDDPISSFDFENKIGIYNYLRKQFKLLFENNEFSQLLITTHDMEAYYNFEKVLQDIILDDGEKAVKKVNKYILTENGLESDKKGQKSNIYNYQFKLIFEFACGNNDEVETYIGNTMRRVCEAFSTFKYKCSIDNLRTDKNIIGLINNSNLKDFFENYLFRLILNNESHQEDDYKGITDKNIDKYLTLTEKIKTARLVIIFLYKLDKMHVVKHLSNKREASEIAKIIESWEQDILNLMN